MTDNKLSIDNIKSTSRVSPGNFRISPQLLHDLTFLNIPNSTIINRYKIRFDKFVYTPIKTMCKIPAFWWQFDFEFSACFWVFICSVGRRKQVCLCVRLVVQARSFKLSQNCKLEYIQITLKGNFMLTMSGFVASGCAIRCYYCCIR